MSVSGVSFLSGAAASADAGPAAPASADTHAVFADALAGASKPLAKPAQAPARRDDAKSDDKPAKAKDDRADRDDAKSVAAETEQRPPVAAAQAASTVSAKDTKGEKSTGTGDAAVRAASRDAALAPDGASESPTAIGELVDPALVAPVLAALAEAASAGQGDTPAVPETAGSPDPAPAAAPQPAPQTEAAAPLPTTAAMMAARAVVIPVAQPKETRETAAPRKARDVVATDKATSADSPAATMSTLAPDPTRADASATIIPEATRQLADGGADRQLDLAKQGAWLDGLSRDIAATGDGSGTLRFQVAPQHLGLVQVELTRGTGGAAVALTASSESARTMLADARPQLVADAKAQGIHIASTQVDVGTDTRQSGGGAQPEQRHHSGVSSQMAGGGANNGRSQTRSQPIAVNQTLDGRADVPADEAESASAAGPADGMYA